MTDKAVPPESGWTLPEALTALCRTEGALYLQGKEVWSSDYDEGYFDDVLREALSRRPDLFIRGWRFGGGRDDHGVLSHYHLLESLSKSRLGGSRKRSLTLILLIAEHRVECWEQGRSFQDDAFEHLDLRQVRVFADTSHGDSQVLPRYERAANECATGQTSQFTFTEEGCTDWLIDWCLAEQERE